MKTLVYLKLQFTKFFALMLIVGLSVGCASLTDANGDTEADVESVSSTTDEPETIWEGGGGDEMDPIVVGPPENP